VNDIEFAEVLKIIDRTETELTYERGEIVLDFAFRMSNPNKWIREFRKKLIAYIKEFGETSQIWRNQQYSDLLSTTYRFLEKTDDNAGYFYYVNYGKKNDNLEYFYFSLVDEGFIDKKIGLVKFRKVFSGEPFTEKIEWKTHVNEVAYLIKSLINLDYIQCKPKRHWDITIKSFYNNQTPITNAATLRKSKIPKCRNKLDGIISTLR
jgi:hypothetical protein